MYRILTKLPLIYMQGVIAIKTLNVQSTYKKTLVTCESADKRTLEHFFPMAFIWFKFRGRTWLSISLKLPDCQTKNTWFKVLSSDQKVMLLFFIPGSTSGYALYPYIDTNVYGKQI